jgi:6-phosphogluconolactonase/glucosamine-6-phosphate isomerase/deaminase
VSGEEKADALRAALTEPVDPHARPASGVSPSDGQLIWWVDEAAFSKVDPSQLGGIRVERPEG